MKRRTSVSSVAFLCSSGSVSQRVSLDEQLETLSWVLVSGAGRPEKTSSVGRNKQSVEEFCWFEAAESSELRRSVWISSDLEILQSLK